MGDETKRLAPQLYKTVASDKRAQCPHGVCKNGKCICMDVEQAGLLKKMIDLGDEIEIKCDGQRICFMNKEYESYEEGICQSYSGSPRMFEFVRNSNAAECGELLKYGNRIGDNFDDWLKLLPVIYYINSQNEIKDRETLIYLSAWSVHRYGFTKLLFRNLCRGMIQCYKEEREERKKKEFGCIAAAMLHKLNEVWENVESEKINLELYHSFDAYRSALDENLGDDYDCYCRMLEEYRDSLPENGIGPRASNSNGDWVECCYLYEILKNVFRLVGITYREPKNMVFAIDMKVLKKSNSTYHSDLRQLNSVRKWSKKKDNILENLYQKL